MQSTKKKGSVRLGLGGETVEIGWSERGFLETVRLSGLSSGGSATPAGDSVVPDRVLRLSEELHRYFESGAPISLMGLDDIETLGWSGFQRKVYVAALSIPHGQTRTYGWIASRIGAPGGSRAVGQALRRNPVPLLVPCHRVVSSQSLGGFMGISNEDGNAEAPELFLKRKLLKLESDFVNPRFQWAELGVG